MHKIEEFPQCFSLYCDLIYDVYKTKASFFGEEETKFKEMFYIAISASLADIAHYAEDYKINITELDAIKLLIFPIPHFKNTGFPIIEERYLRSVFICLESIYSVKLDIDELNQSIKVCMNLLESDNIVPVYTFVKGIQEGIKAKNV